jgi:hypothetical protein
MHIAGHRALSRARKMGLLLACLAMASPALAKERLLGSWCDETGYRIELSADKIVFRDRQLGDPPPGTDLTFGEGVAVYRQDFRPTRMPELDIIDCTLRLTGPDRAEETCRGPGYGFMPFIQLKRCPQEVIS